MNQDKISARQVYVILFAALLSPAVRALPTWTVGAAGVGAWLTGLTALPALLAMGWVYFRLFQSAGPDRGLHQIFGDVLGKAAGKGLTIIYMVWALFLLTVEARLYGERMLAANAKNSSLPVLLFILLALVFWLARKKVAAFARAAEIFYLVLAITLGVVLFFSVLDMQPANVLPIWIEDVPGIAAATVVPLGVVGAGVFAAFLGGHVTPMDTDRRRGVRWLCAGCAALALLQFGVLVQVGPELAGRMDTPFFEVARGVGVAGAFQRVEAVVVALWLLSDLALLGLLVFALRCMGRWVLGQRAESWVAPGAVLLAFVGAVFLLPDGFVAKNLSSTVVLWGNLVLGFAVPIFIRLVQSAKTGKPQAHI